MEVEINKIRKIIQITSAAEHHKGARLFCLCNDGTVWELNEDSAGIWQPHDNIPQPSQHELNTLEDYKKENFVIDDSTPTINEIAMNVINHDKGTLLFLRICNELISRSPEQFQTLVNQAVQHHNRTFEHYPLLFSYKTV